MTYTIHNDIHNTPWHTQYTMTYTTYSWQTQYTMTHKIHNDILNTQCNDIHNTQWHTQYTIHNDTHDTRWYTQYTMTYTTYPWHIKYTMTYTMTLSLPRIWILHLWMRGIWSFKCAYMCLYVYASVDYALCIWVTIIICGITYPYGNRKNHIHIKRQTDSWCVRVSTKSLRWTDWEFMCMCGVCIGVSKAWT